MNNASTTRNKHRSTYSEQATALEPSMLVRTAELRDSAVKLTDDVVGFHSSVQMDEVQKGASELSLEDVPDLLSTISYDLGFSWALVAKMLGVTTAAIRKWRKGNVATPANRLALAEIVSFSRFVKKINPRIDDVSLWMSTPISSETTLTAADLFAMGAKSSVLDFASGRLTATQVLDDSVSGWRENYVPDRDFKVVEAPDGMRSIVPADS